MQRIIVTTMFIVLGITGPLLAQQTTGNINGRLVDAALMRHAENVLRRADT